MFQPHLRGPGGASFTLDQVRAVLHALTSEDRGSSPDGEPTVTDNSDRAATDTELISADGARRQAPRSDLTCLSLATVIAIVKAGNVDLKYITAEHIVAYVKAVKQKTTLTWSETPKFVLKNLALYYTPPDSGNSPSTTRMVRIDPADVFFKTYFTSGSFMAMCDSFLPKLVPLALYYASKPLELYPNARKVWEIERIVRMTNSNKPSVVAGAVLTMFFECLFRSKLISFLDAKTRIVLVAEMYSYALRLEDSLKDVMPTVSDKIADLVDMVVGRPDATAPLSAGDQPTNPSDAACINSLVSLLAGFIHSYPSRARQNPQLIQKNTKPVVNALLNVIEQFFRATHLCFDPAAAADDDQLRHVAAAFYIVVSDGSHVPDQYEDVAPGTALDVDLDFDLDTQTPPLTKYLFVRPPEEEKKKKSGWTGWWRCAWPSRASIQNWWRSGGTPLPPRPLERHKNRILAISGQLLGGLTPLKVGWMLSIFNAWALVRIVRLSYVGRILSTSFPVCEQEVAMHQALFPNFTQNLAQGEINNKHYSCPQ